MRRYFPLYTLFPSTLIIGTLFQLGDVIVFRRDEHHFEADVKKPRQGRGLRGGFKSPRRQLQNMAEDTVDDVLDASTALGDESYDNPEFVDSSAPSVESTEPKIDYSLIPQIPLGPHVNLSAFGPDGIDATHYTLVKVLTRPLGILHNLINVDIMCQFWPSSCKKEAEVRTKRSLFSKRRRRRRCTCPRPRRSSVSSPPESDSDFIDSPKRRFHFKNVEPVPEMLRDVVDVSQTVLDMYNDQQDRAISSSDDSSSEDDYDYESSDTSVSSQMPKLNVTHNTSPMPPKNVSTVVAAAKVKVSTPAPARKTTPASRNTASRG